MKYCIINGKDQQGQMLLIVILTMIVALTVGLSIVSRTVVNLKVSKQNEESQRAFQAAEAGIEQAIKQIQTNGPSSTTINPVARFGNNSTYTTAITVTNNNRTFLINSGTPLTQDSGADVWLSQYPNFGSPRTRPIANPLYIYWGTSGQTCSGSGSNIAPALEILVLSGAVANPTVSKYVFEASCNRIPGASSSNASPITISGVTLQRQAIVAFNSGLIMKIIPIFNSGIVGIDAPAPGPPLWSQGATIVSTGTSGDTARKINYFLAYPQIPAELFPYSLVSQN